MAGLGGKRSISSVWSAIQAAVYPEGQHDAACRRAFEEEAQESNARTMRWLVFVLVPVNLMPALVLALRPAESAAAAAWSFSASSLSAAIALLGGAFGVIAWRRKPAALWRVIGDVIGVLGLAGASLRSANTQRLHPTVNLFIAAAFFVAFLVRMRPKVFVTALLASATFLLGSIAILRSEGIGRVADELAVITISAAVLAGFFILRGMRLRELVARRQVERLNADLERRVEAQVHEIVLRAREVEELNIQLNARIQERSQELSRALARLAERHTAIAPGTVLGGRAEIGEEIGQGGMGVVYRGRDLVTNKTVAIKVVQAGSANELDGLYRFLREARVMASVAHSAIVRSIHVDVSEDGRLFQMMELVDGETLEACLARCGQLPGAVASRLGAVLAAALAAAHAAGVIHRDVKPSNVMLTRAAPGLKLLDFGISKLWDARATSSHTVGQVLGTPEFLSPEQVEDPANVGPPVDVYALGLILYRCVAGRMPFDSSGLRRWLMMHVRRAPLELARQQPDVDPEMARTVMACLHNSAADRPTAKAVAEALSGIAERAATPPLEALELLQRVSAAPATLTTGPAAPDQNA